MTDPVSSANAGDTTPPEDAPSPSAAPDESEAPSSGPPPTAATRPRRRKSVHTAINFHSYPKLMFAWPLIVAAPVFSMLLRLGVSAEVLGWLYLMLMTLVVLTLSIDIERNQAFMLLLTIVALWFFGAWLADAKGVPIYGDIYRWFADIDLEYDPKFAMVLSIFLAFAYLLMLIGVRFNNKWRITHNEIEHRAWGRREKAYPRIGKTFRTMYPDWLEALFCLSGSLVVSDSRGEYVVTRIDHIPLLPLLARKLDRILETWSVTITQEEMGVQVADEEAMDDGQRR